MSASSVVLFACSRCFSRHPFEELSSGQQLCKECRGTYPVVKCTYCRSEFQQTSKGSTSTICRKCEYNVRQHGKPTACEYCNIIAAFGSSKCLRCTHSELKYGPAVTCDQCRQRCAFDRHDENKKIDGKLMCWLCTLSYKRAVVKARQNETDHHHRMAKKRPSSERQMKDPTTGGGGGGSGANAPSSHKRPHHSISTSSARPDHRSIGAIESSMGGGGGGGGSSSSNSASKSGVDMSSSAHGHGHNRHGHGHGSHGSHSSAPGPVDHNSSEHMVAMTQLKEQIASLNKKLAAKDRELLSKDKHTTELKSRNFVSENELRTKMKDTEKYYETKIDVLNKKVAGLLKEVAQLRSGAKRAGTAGSQSNGNGGGAGSMSSSGGSVLTMTSASSAATSSSSKESGSGSGTDSPNTN